MKKVRVLTAEEAALLVNDGDTIATGGFVSCACPEALSKALEKRFLETGHPRDLTLFFAAGQGHRDGTGGDHYGHEGMVKRVIGGHWDRAPKLGDLALSNKIEAYNLPQAGKLPETILPHSGGGWTGAAGTPCPPTHLRHQSGQRSQTAEWNHPRALSPAGGRPPRPLHLGNHRTLLREKGYLPPGRDHGRIRSLKKPPKKRAPDRKPAGQGRKTLMLK